MVSDIVAGAARMAAATGGYPRAPSFRSLTGLDGVNFMMADVQGGVGPYLSVFLAGSRGWESGPIGIAMAVSSVAGALCQVPAGLLVDATRWKRLLIVLSALAVGIGASLSNVIGGYVVQGFGYPTGFLGLAAVALCALVFFLILMPETGQDGTDSQTTAAP